MSTTDHTPSKWEIEQQLRDAQRAHEKAAGAYGKRLADVLEQYANRRTVEAEMVRAVADLAVGRVAEVEAHYEARIAGLTEAHELQLARTQKSRDEAHDRATTTARMLEDWRMVREERTADGDTDAEVTFRTGTDHWTVAALEEVAYRLRCGGATDDSRVKANHRTMSATVPAPNLVPLEAPAVSTREVARPSQPAPPVARVRTRASVVIPTVAVAAVLLLVNLLVMVIW